MAGVVSLTITVDISQVVDVFDRIQLRKYNTPRVDTPSSPVTDTMAMNDYSLVASGTDEWGGCYPDPCKKTGVSEIILNESLSQYYFTDQGGSHYDWYISRYYNSSNGSTSGWADPVLGESGDIFYNPMYPDEIGYGSEDRQIIDRIRTYIGDPKGLRREYGEDAASSIHPDGKTYEMDERGWPAMINMGGTSYISPGNPSVNGYRFLRFAEYIDTESIDTVWSGCSSSTYTHGVDIWYYTFRHSNREIIEAYDRCPIPAGLTAANVTVEAYVLQTSINLLFQDNWEDAIEDGAVVTDETTRYDPSVGFRFRNDLMDKLKAKLDDLVKGLVLRGIEGVLID